MATKPKHSATKKRKSSKTPPEVRTTKQLKLSFGKKTNEEKAFSPNSAETNKAAVPVAGWKWRGTLMLWESPDIVHSNKIASFDFDGTLARTSLYRHGPDAWSVLFPGKVEAKLAALAADGYKLVIFTNQANIGRATKTKQKTILEKQGRLMGFVEKVGLPFQIFAATSKAKVPDLYRKPETGMWDFLAEKKNGGTKIDYDKSFYVGDAAGRKSDHSNSDKQFAENVSIKFYNETEFFKDVLV